TIDEVGGICRTLLSESRAERSLRKVIHPGRIDVIGAGALIWSRIVARVSEAAGVVSARTSEHDILDGIALDLLDRVRSEEHTSELQSRFDLVCRLLLEKKKHYDGD